MTEDQIRYIADHTNGYTGADLRLLITEASLHLLQNLHSSDLRLSFEDIKRELPHIRPSALREVAVTIPNVAMELSVHL